MTRVGVPGDGEGDVPASGTRGGPSPAGRPRSSVVLCMQIKVEIVDLKVTVNGDLATARFRQIYASDTLSTSSRKTLSLARSSQGKWVIKQEAVGG